MNARAEALLGILAVAGLVVGAYVAEGAESAGVVLVVVCLIYLGKRHDLV